MIQLQVWEHILTLGIDWRGNPGAAKRGHGRIRGIYCRRLHLTLLAQTKSRTSIHSEPSSEYWLFESRCNISETQRINFRRLIKFVQFCSVTLTPNCHARLMERIKKGWVTKDIRRSIKLRRWMHSQDTSHPAFSSNMLSPTQNSKFNTSHKRYRMEAQN